MTTPEPGGRTFGPDFLTELFRNPLEPGYADAAERRERLGPRTGWRQRSIRGISLLTLAVLGFLLVVAYRQTVADAPARTSARAGLVEQVQQRQGQTDALQWQADRLRDEVAVLRDAALTGTEAAQLRDLEAVTGLARVHGNGVVIRLADGLAPADAVTGNRPNLGRVFDRDLQDLANALWAVGAEAIAVNGQRLTATSTIRAAGAAILVDYRPVTSPYEVSAIGPDDLDERIRDTPAGRLFRRLAGEVGMAFDVRAGADLTLPAAAEPQLRFARPVPSPVPGGSAPASPVPGGSAPAPPAATGTGGAGSLPAQDMSSPAAPGPAPAGPAARRPGPAGSQPEGGR